MANSSLIEPLLTIENKGFYLVEIKKGMDAVNQFFEFTVVVRHADVSVLNTVLPEQTGQLVLGELHYDFEIVNTHINLVSPPQVNSQQDKLMTLELRPLGWRALQHKSVRVFEVQGAESDDNLNQLDDPLNYYFPPVPDLEEMTKLFNLLSFKSGQQAPVCSVDFVSSAQLYDYRLDWWQNQLAFQIQQTNAEAFKRLVWKAGASFVYKAHSDRHKFIVLPDLCEVSKKPQVVVEDDLSSFQLSQHSINRFDRWSFDVFNAALMGNSAADSVALDDANQNSYESRAVFGCNVAISPDLAVNYTSDNGDEYLLMPLKVEHYFNHREGYHCQVEALQSHDKSYFDLSSLDELPSAFDQSIMATVHSYEGNKVGDRDFRARYLVKFDFALTQNGRTFSPSAWLHATRPSTGAGGEGAFSALQTGSKVVVQMMNGDREQALITHSFLTQFTGEKTGELQ